MGGSFVLAQLFLTLSFGPTTLHHSAHARILTLIFLSFFLKADSEKNVCPQKFYLKKIHIYSDTLE